MEKIEIVKPANLLLYKKGYSIDFVRRTIENKSLNGLCISDALDPLLTLDFLADYSFLTHLSIGSIHDHDYCFLKELIHLEWLFIGMSVTTKNMIDFSRQTELNYLGIYWRKNITGLEKCKRLEKLMLMDFKEKDLLPLNSLSALKELTINTASIKNLNGIQGCEYLESIFLGNCRYLEFISALSHLHNLRKIELDVVSHIIDYGAISDLPELTELTMRDCKRIPSIDFIRNFPSMRKIVLTGNTEVVDGDMTPVTSLNEVFYSNNKHYNIKYPPPNFRRY